MYTHICTHTYIHTYIYISHLVHFGSALIYLPSVSLTQSLPSFQFPMCKYNSISSGRWHGADVACHSCVVICMAARPGFQSHCRLHFSSISQNMECHRHLTFSSSGAETATYGACCRLSGASLLCGSPNLCLNTVFEFFLGMGRAL